METPLESACKKVIGNEYMEYYNLLGNLLLLNYDLIKKSDQRLSAKVTAIIFDEELRDKSHLICLFLENSEMNVSFSTNDIENTKKLLELDPQLDNTQKIIDAIKPEIISDNFDQKLQLIVREDLEKYMITERGKFIHRY